MPVLVLDLDETVFVTKERHGHIHPNHSKSPDIVGAIAGAYKLTVNIINPEQLSVLINTACIIYDGVLILTSGAWEPSVCALLIPYLNLTLEAATQFKNCRFHSSSTDSELFNINGSILHQMDKYARLKMIVNYYADLKKQKLVLLDDSKKHRNAILRAPDNTMIAAVLAATDRPEQDFYQKTLSVLARAKQQENRLKDAEYFYARLEQENLFFRQKKPYGATLINVAPKAVIGAEIAEASEAPPVEGIKNCCIIL
ncbi:MAG: hypothetical protein P4L65_07690 [Legionella sp.]|nr:hypothetical protein [Legionella sp.]